jgi:Domain of unknown function (DUF4386)
MKTTKETARFAGILYLLVAVTGAFSLLYVPAVFIVPGDATATARRVAEAELTYRICILIELACQILSIFLGLSLYRLFKDTDKKYIILLVILTSVYVSVRCFNLFNQIAPLILWSGADFLSIFTKPQLDALAFGFLRTRNNWFGIVSAFWGLWFFPFGILVIKSGFFPKFLGVLLMVAGFAYLANSFTSIVLPAHKNAVNLFTLPLEGVGELSMIVWLLVKRANLQPPEDPVSRAL